MLVMIGKVDMNIIGILSFKHKQKEKIAHFSFLIFLSPVFSGLYEFCSIYTGASLQGAMQLNHEVT